MEAMGPASAMTTARPRIARYWRLFRFKLGNTVGPLRVVRASRARHPAKVEHLLSFRAVFGTNSGVEWFLDDFSGLKFQ